MPRDVLKALGLDEDDDNHPANKVVLKALGLNPEDEAPVSRSNDPYNLGRPEDRFNAPTPSPPSWLSTVHQTLDPATAIPAAVADIGHNIGEHSGSAASMASQGYHEVFNNQPASGVGHAVMGALGVPLSLVAGPVKSGENLLAGITGNPDFANKAAMMVPFNVGGPAAAAATHAVLPSTKALDIVAERMTPEMLARMQSNPRLRPMDVSKGVRDLGVGIAKDTSQPRAMAPIVSSMEHSAATAKDAVRGTYDEALGSPPNLWEEKIRLENKAKAIGQSKIAPPLITAKPVDTSAVISDIDKALNPTAVKMTPGTTITPTPLQQELVGLRQKLASGDKEVLTDADRLHDVQSELRRRGDDLMSSATGSDRTLGRELKDYRNKLVSAIDASAPGYKKGLEAYRDQKDIERAFEFGRDVLKNTDDIKTDPSYLAQWVKHKDRSPEELEAARLGARQAIESKMGRIKSSGLDPGRSGTDVPQIDFNRQKIESLFGKEATDKMFKHLQDERDIAVTNSRGLSNSTTAEAQAAQQLLKPRDIAKPHSQLPSWALTLGAGAGALTTSPTVGALVGGGLLGARAAKAGYDMVGRSMDLSRNASLAQLISRNDPETIAQLTAAISRSGRRNKLDNLLAPP